jgi:hypothetical protein
MVEDQVASGENARDRRIGVFSARGVLRGRGLLRGCRRGAEPARARKFECDAWGDPRRGARRTGEEVACIKPCYIRMAAKTTVQEI